MTLILDKTIALKGEYFLKIFFVHWVSDILFSVQSSSDGKFITGDSA